MKKLLFLLLLSFPVFAQQPVKDLADGPVTAGAAPSFSQLFGCQYNTSLPTPSNTQQVAIQCDSTGRVIVDVANTVTVTGTGGTFPVTGTVATTQSTSPWIVAGGGTAGTPGTAVLTIQGVGSGTAVPISGSVTAACSTACEVSPTTAANTLSNQFFTQLSDGTHGQTFMSTTTSSKYGADMNILAILGTAPTTAGFLDIKGADGNVFVRQATAANLNATVVGTGTFAIQCAACALESGGNLATLAGGVTSSVYQENLKQVNGVTTLTGAGATGTGAQRETVSQDTTTIAGSAPGTAGTASSNVLSVQGVASMTPVEVSPTTAANTSSNQFFMQQVDGTNKAIVDPCQGQTKTFIAGEITANTKIAAGTSAKSTYFCSWFLQSATAETVGVVEGTGTVCATSTVTYPGLTGGTSTSTGPSWAANGGMTLASGGYSIGKASVAADDVCIFVSGSGQVNYSGSYVQQ